MSNGFRGFIINFEHLETLYAKKFVFIFINTLTGFLTLIYGYCWKELIDDRTHNINKPVTRFFAFLICAIFLNIAIFPLHLFINIILFIIVFIFDCSLRVLDDNLFTLMDSEYKVIYDKYFYKKIIHKMDWDGDLVFVKIKF